MNYLESYIRVVNESKLEILEKLFENQKLKAEYKIDKAEINYTDDRFPYLLMYADYQELKRRGGGPGVKMLVTSADFSGLLREFLPDFYCLPCILLSRDVPEELCRVLDPDVYRKHELLHLRKLISLYQEKPEFQKLRFNSGFSTCRDEKELRDCISMTLEEFFYLEPSAHQFNYENGQRMIFDFFAGKVIYFPAESGKDYVRYSLAKYIYEIERDYINTADKTGISSNLFRDEFNVFGNSVYGANAYKKYRKFQSEMDETLINYSLENNRGIIDYICNGERERDERESGHDYSD